LIFLVQIHRFSSSHIILLYISGRSQRIKFNQNLTRKKSQLIKWKHWYFKLIFILFMFEKICVGIFCTIILFL
jgi:hypothetical protein